MVKLDILLFDENEIDSFLFGKTTSDICNIYLINKPEFTIDPILFDFIFIDIDFDSHEETCFNFINKHGFSKDSIFFMSSHIDEILIGKNNRIFDILLFSKRMCFKDIYSFLKNAYRQKNNGYELG